MVAMAMAVMGDTVACPHVQNSPAYNERLAGKAWEQGYVQSITAIHTIIRLLSW